jgi:hypothetical protein
MKRTVMSLLLAGLVLGSVIARPAARASADTMRCDVGYSVVLNILGVFPIACGFDIDSGEATDCSLTNVDVGQNETTGAYDYQFDLIDGTSSPCNMHVQGTYNPSTKLADEQLTGNNGSRVQAIWICSDDPWSFLPGQTPSCQNRSLLTTNADGSAGDAPSMTFPVSAQILNDFDRHVLNAQLQNAIKAVIAQQQEEQSARTIRHVSESASCIPCVAAAAATAPTAVPVLPDFAAHINGPAQISQGFSATYEVVLANLGAKPTGLVQIEIQVTGSLRYLQMVQTPAGFDCLGTGPITCTGPLGGYGDASAATVADFQLQIQGAQTGTGSISASANPSGTIQESDTSNNAQTLAVTVK